MNLLFDTHLLLWLADDSERLSAAARDLIADADSNPFFSAASIWEISIKTNLGRADFEAEPRLVRRGLIENGWVELSVTGEHAVATLDLPPIHKDPFDRILLAQARIEGMTLLTSDAVVAKYPGAVRKV
jgi:PIN domain nuclease of toxin-antitoxin system